jgi:Poxvirus A32 protein
MATHVRVRKFDPDTVKKHRIMLLVGRRGSGKSSLLADLLYNLKDRFDYCVAMCPTMESANMLRSCMPESCVYNRFSPAKMELLVNTARELAAKGKERSFLLVLDDVFYDKTICRSQAFRFLFLNGRHCRIFCICLLQYCVDLPPDLRANVDYVFSMREPMLANRIKLFKMFFGVFGSYDDFAAVFDRCTQNFECICLDNTAQTTGVTDCIFWYKARIDLPPFKLGLRLFYDLHDRYKRAEGSTAPTAEEQEAGAVAAAKKPKLTVHKEDNDDDEHEDER